MDKREFALTIVTGFAAGAIVNAIMLGFLLLASCDFHAGQAARFGLGIVYQAADSVIY